MVLALSLCVFVCWCVDHTLASSRADDDLARINRAIWIEREYDQAMREDNGQRDARPAGLLD